MNKEKKVLTAIKKRMDELWSNGEVIAEIASGEHEVDLDAWFDLIDTAIEDEPLALEYARIAVRREKEAAKILKAKVKELKQIWMFTADLPLLVSRETSINWEEQNYEDAERGEYEFQKRQRGESIKGGETSGDR